MLAYFERHGWPIVGSQVEDETAGEATSRLLTMLATRATGDVIHGLGSGLYIPYALRNVEPVALSPNVAKAVISMEGETVNDKDHLRLFRVLRILEQRGQLSMKMSRTIRGGLRRQTIRFVLNDDARAWLEKTSMEPRDAF